jgi:hypothetical protein
VREAPQFAKRLDGQGPTSGIDLAQIIAEIMREHLAMAISMKRASHAPGSNKVGA